jgi:hypothetical protein
VPAPSPQPPAVSAPPPVPSESLRGSLEITSRASGTVSIDGKAHGQPPIRLEDLDPGRYVVTIEFDELGGGRREVVEVRGGSLAKIYFEPSLAREKAAYRRGLNFGAAVGPSVVMDYFEEYFGGGVRASFLLNVGIIPAVDFRTGLDVMMGGLYAGYNATRFAGFFTVPAQLHFNLGSVYTIMVGGVVGVSTVERVLSREFSATQVETTTERREVFVTGGPTASVATFRFGDRRQFELSLQNTMLAAGPYKRDGVTVFGRTDATFTMLFLPETLSP